MEKSSVSGAGGYADDIYAYGIAPTFEETDNTLRDVFKRQRSSVMDQTPQFSLGNVEVP